MISRVDHTAITLGVWSRRGMIGLTKFKVLYVWFLQLPCTHCYHTCLADKLLFIHIIHWYILMQESYVHSSSSCAPMSWFGSRAVSWVSQSPGDFPFHVHPHKRTKKEIHECCKYKCLGINFETDWQFRRPTPSQWWCTQCLHPVGSTSPKSNIKPLQLL
jgi:hypothetical protein